ncbi:MAG: hypothetical protein R3B90_11590 [Planctomycetaceae bacterium]
MRFLRFQVVVALMFCLVLMARADADDVKSSSDTAAEKAEPKASPEAPLRYRGELRVGEEAVPYRARLSSMEIARNESETKAKVSYTEYLRLGIEDRDSTGDLCFNGGPGSASLWLHLGGLSPRRIELLPDELNPRSWELRPNEGSILDVTDLVFIDPVSTGFSRPEKQEEKGEFHGFDNDIDSISEFIRRWTAENGRWASPQYVLGESYGGIRGVSIARHLFNKHNYQLEGLILVSPVIDFQTIRFSESNDLPYVMFLPSYAATAWHHDKIDREKFVSLDALLQEAESFAIGDYATALLLGDRLGKRERRQIVQRMSELTGLSKVFIERANLRVSMSRFGKELLRDSGKIVGRFDGRFTSPTWDHTGEGTEFDPSGSFISGAFTEALQQYYFDEFKLRDPKRYAVSGDVHPWDYSRFEGRFANGADALRETMTEQPNLRVLFTLGYTDLATPYMGSLHTISHLDVPPAIRSNIQTTFYDAGHMMYLRKSEQTRLKVDLDKFYAGDAEVAK